MILARLSTPLSIMPPQQCRVKATSSQGCWGGLIQWGTLGMQWCQISVRLSSHSLCWENRRFFLAARSKYKLCPLRPFDAPLHTMTPWHLHYPCTRLGSVSPVYTYSSTFPLLPPSSTPCLVSGVSLGFKWQHGFRSKPPGFKHHLSTS